MRPVVATTGPTKPTYQKNRGGGDYQAGNMLAKVLQHGLSRGYMGEGSLGGNAFPGQELDPHENQGSHGRPTEN